MLTIHPASILVALVCIQPVRLIRGSSRLYSDPDDPLEDYLTTITTMIVSTNLRQVVVERPSNRDRPRIYLHEGYLLVKLLAMVIVSVDTQFYSILGKPAPVFLTSSLSSPSFSYEEHYPDSWTDLRTVLAKKSPWGLACCHIPRTSTFNLVGRILSHYTSSPLCSRGYSLNELMPVELRSMLAV